MAKGQMRSNKEKKKPKQDKDKDKSGAKTQSAAISDLFRGVDKGKKDGKKQG